MISVIFELSVALGTIDIQSSKTFRVLSEVIAIV